MRHLATLVIALTALTACGGVTQVRRASDAAAGAGGSASWEAGVDAPAEASTTDAEAGSPDAAVPCTHDSDCPTGVPAKCGATCVQGKCVFAPPGVACNCPLGAGDAGAKGGACDGHGGCVVCPIDIMANSCADDSACCVWYDQYGTGHSGPYNYDYGSCSDNHVCKLCSDPGHYCDAEHHCCTGLCDWAINRCP